MAEIRPSGRVRLSALAEGSDRYKKLKGFPTKIGKPLFDGRDGEIRTRDLTHPKRARYQAAPRPVKAISSMAGMCPLSNDGRLHFCLAFDRNASSSASP